MWVGSLRLSAAPETYPWERPLGALPVDDGLVEFRVWAPHASDVRVRVGDRAPPHARRRATGSTRRASRREAGDDYGFVLGDARAPRPGDALAARRAARAVAVVDPRAFAWTDAGFEPHALADARHLRAARRHVHRRGHVRRRDRAPARRSPSSASPRSRSCRSPSSPARTAGATTASTSRRAQSSYGGPEGFARLVDAAHAAGLARASSTSSTTTSAPSGQQALEAFGPYFTDKLLDVLGRGDQLRRRDCDPVREWVAAVRRGLGRATSTSTACAWTRSTRSTTDARGRSSRELADRVHAARPGALVIAESGLNDPTVIRPPSRAASATTPQWADDFHHALRALLTGEREGYYEEFGDGRRPREGLPRARSCTTAQYSTFRTRRFGAPGRRPPARAVRRLRPEPRPGRQPRARRPAARAGRGRWPRSARCCRRSPRCSSWARSTASPRRSSSSPTTSTRRSPTATREGRRREFAAFAAFAGEEVPDPQDPATFERSKLTRERDPAARALYARPAARAPRAARDEARHRPRRGRALAARRPRAVPSGLQLRRRAASGAARRPAATAIVLATARRRAAARRRGPCCPRSPERSLR